MKTEHEKLKEICDKIGYDYMWHYMFNENWTEKVTNWSFVSIDVREIIFTTEFVAKFNKYRIDQLDLTAYGPWKNSRLWEILNHLNNPVDYLYHLIKPNE